MSQTVKKYSIDDLDSLMESIHQASGLSDKDIMARIKRNMGYVSQIRSRGEGVPEKLIQALKSEFKEELNRNNIVLTTVTAKPNFGDTKPVNTNEKLIDTVSSQQQVISKQLEEISKLTSAIIKLVETR